jgi:hypothetical protein
MCRFLRAFGLAGTRLARQWLVSKYRPPTTKKTDNMYPLQYVPTRAVPLAGDKNNRRMVSTIHAIRQQGGGHTSDAHGRRIFSNDERSSFCRLTGPAASIKYELPPGANSSKKMCPYPRDSFVFFISVGW